MSHYRPYPAYKDSGVEWIGPVPEHWETLRIKRAAQLRNERRNDSPSGWTYVGLEDVEPESGKYEPTVGASRQSEDSMVGVFRAGDVLYGKLRPYLRKAIVAEQDGVCSTEFLVLSEGRGKSPWLHRWLLTQEVTQQIEAGCDGAKMPRADWEHVGSIPMPLPPAAEQTAIAAALDRETARIDALIAKKTRFIELLKEKRQAFITHAVTKGLDPNVKMKDSGVEWIGEVPEHWIVSQVKFVATIGNGSTPARDRPDYWEQGTYPWLTSSCVNQEQIGAAEEFVTSTAMSECHLPIIRPPAILVGITGQGRTRGMATTLSIEATINQHIAFLKANEARIQTPFLRRFIDVAYDWLRLDSEGAGSTKGAITCEQLGALPVPLPPAAEQERIITHVTGMTARTDSLAAKAERSIALLKERRSALITAAVTGQIDLRLSNANQP